MALTGRKFNMSYDGTNSVDSESEIVRADDCGFSDPEFVALDVKEAIKETGSIVASIVIPITCVLNGNIGNGTWITYSNLTGNSRIVSPVTGKLVGFTYSTSESSDPVATDDFDITFRINGRTTTILDTVEIRDMSDGFEPLNISVNQGDLVDPQYIDQGNNASDLVITFLFRAS